MHWKKFRCASTAVKVSDEIMGPDRQIWPIIVADNYDSTRASYCQWHVPDSTLTSYCQWTGTRQHADVLLSVNGYQTARWRLIVSERVPDSTLTSYCLWAGTRLHADILLSVSGYQAARWRLMVSERVPDSTLTSYCQWRVPPAWPIVG